MNELDKKKLSDKRGGKPIILIMTVHFQWVKIKNVAMYEVKDTKCVMKIYLD